MQNKEICALVLGGYVNGYSIIQELHEEGVENIVLFQYGSQLAGLSNKVSRVVKIDKTPEGLRRELIRLNGDYAKLVLYPTDDLQLEHLSALCEDIQSFCFLPFNQQNVLSTLDKYIQYQACEKLGVPYPKTIELDSTNSIDVWKDIQFPVLIKPSKREDLNALVFRSLYLEHQEALEQNRKRLARLLGEGFTFLVSEVIPGDSNGSIFAYTAYRSSNTKKIENEWVGKKLTQFPDDFGVFSSASNEGPDVVREQGRKLIEGMDLYGICEPEFKFDPRDGKYKLMEINLRSMMWHRAGNLSGVKLQYTQWKDAIGESMPKYSQHHELVHFSYLKHEILNLFYRGKYWKLFKNNLCGGAKNTLALFDKTDLKPFVFDQIGTIKAIFRGFVKRKILRR